MDCEKGKTNVAQILYLLWLLVKGYRLFLAVVWQSWVKFQKQETGKVIKREGVTKDVPTWFDLPQTFLKTDERHRKCQSNSFRVTSLCKLLVVLSFKMITEWSLYMVSHIDCKPFSSFESVLAGISSVDIYACLQLRWSFGPSRHKDKRKTRGMTTALIMKFCLHFKVRHKIKKKFNC